MKTYESNTMGDDDLNALDKPALGECAMSLAATLLMGCQRRGAVDDPLGREEEDRPPAPLCVTIESEG